MNSEATDEIYLQKSVNLLQMQKLMGSLNDICLMCPFLNSFKKPLNKILGFLQRNPSSLAFLSQQAKSDLKVFFKFLSERNSWFPIPHRPSNPPISKLVFTSDAAGCNENTPDNEKVGCASLGLDLNGKIFFVSQLFWPLNVLKTHKDNKGRSLGLKTTTLEFLGLILPFLAIPKNLKNQHIVLEVDNISCIFAWENKYSKEDDYASVLVRSLSLITAFLGSKVYIRHLPRVSNWQASMVDRMSRKTTTTSSDLRLLESFNVFETPPVLKRWMENPSDDLTLALDLLSLVEEKCDVRS